MKSEVRRLRCNQEPSSSAWEKISAFEIIALPCPQGLARVVGQFGVSLFEEEAMLGQEPQTTVTGMSSFIGGGVEAMGITSALAQPCIL